MAAAADGLAYCVEVAGGGWDLGIRRPIVRGCWPRGRTTMADVVELDLGLTGATISAGAGKGLGALASRGCSRVGGRGAIHVMAGGRNGAGTAGYAIPRGGSRVEFRTRAYLI